MSRRGYVYVLTNRSMPGMVKVGMTRRHPHARARELSAVTGVPLPFRVAWYAEVQDCAAIEGRVKGALDAHRVNGNREFFGVSVDQARAAIQAAAAGHVGRGTSPRPWRAVWPRRRRPASLYGRGVELLRIGLFLVLGLIALGVL